MRRKNRFPILILSLALCVFAIGTTGSAQTDTDVAGTWVGAIEIPGTPLEVTVTLVRADDGSLSGDIDIPLQNARDLPLSDFSEEGNSIGFSISGIPGSPAFAGTVSEDGKMISGDFSQAGRTMPFALTRQEAAEDAAASEELNNKLEMLRAFIDSTMGSWNTPGVAMAIVKGDEVIFSEGFGYRNLEEELPVTDKTLFAIGSSSKAFTATAVGLLVADGTLDWDTPVREYLPDFQLHNSYASDHMTPKDLLSHRSGLPRHDFVWYGSPTTREELFARLKYIEFSEDFRNAWQYQNLMFMTAGYLVGQMSGSTWEDVVQKRLFDPLGMSTSNFSVETSQKTSDFAYPYGVEDDKPNRIPFRNIDEVGPAGSINSSVSEMANWVRIQLRDGRLGETEVVPEEVIDETHRPQMVMPGGRSSNEYFHSLYGLGWFIQPYRGNMRIHHGGSIDGFQALVSFLPDDDIGMVVLTNRGGSPMPTFASLYATDLLLDLEPIGWHNRAIARREENRQRQEENEDEEDDEAARVEGTDYGHDLADYAGIYEHPAYGSLVVEEGDDLLLTFNGLEFDLDHWHYEVFRGAVGESRRLTFMFTFVTDMKGDVSEVHVPFEPSVDPIVFTRKAPDKLRDEAYLKTFVGEYDLQGMTVTVALKGTDLLQVTVPGQPTYDLDPYKENRFNLKGLNGYSVVFTVADGAVTELAFHQPNGVFTATKK